MIEAAILRNPKDTKGVLVRDLRRFNSSVDQYGLRRVFGYAEGAGVDGGGLLSLVGATLALTQMPERVLG
jgi:hypothetical protein